MPDNGKQKTVVVGGVTYTLQRPPARWVLQLRDRTLLSDRSDRMERYCAELLEHVVIDPKVTLDTFASVAELDELVKEIRNFL